MRVLGNRVPPGLARIIRRRLGKVSTWPSENILIVGWTLFVRSRILESPISMEHLSGGALFPTKLKNLRVWRPWWVVRPKLYFNYRIIFALSCQPFGRWGNRVVQAAAGIAAAEVLGARHFFLRSNDFAAGLTLPLNGGVSLVGVCPDDPRLMGNLAFPKNGLVVEANWLLSQSSFRDRRKVIDAFRNLRTADLLVSEYSQEQECDLVIHFRGTDQLTRDWRPPPLAYFLLSAIHSQAENVTVVTDDPLNSLVAELLKLLRKHNVGASVQSSTLADDVATLGNASTVCIGVGTFASSILSLSRRTRTIYSWKHPDWSSPHGDFLGTFDLRPDLLNFRIEDMTRTYELPFAQESGFPPSSVHRHMKEFPMNNLRILSSPPEG